MNNVPPPVDRDQLSAAVADYSRRTDKRCILCGTAKVHAVSTFIPNEPWLFDPTPPADGKVRAVLFAICWPCFMRDALSDGRLVETKLRKMNGGAS